MDSFVYESFFRAMSPPRRQALFIMAAVGEFTAALLQALGVPESAEAIVQGEQLGIVQRRGRAADAAYYTLHPLIAERALERFAGAAADRADAVRSSSARWWHARGEIHRAIRTALQGGDARLACGYLASYAPQLVQAEGRHETFLHLLAQVESRGRRAQWRPDAPGDLGPGVSAPLCASRSVAGASRTRLRPRALDRGAVDPAAHLAAAWGDRRIVRRRGQRRVVRTAMAGRAGGSGSVPQRRRADRAGVCAQVQRPFHRRRTVPAKGADQVRTGPFALWPDVGCA
jgi:hypothetical protein